MAERFVASPPGNQNKETVRQFQEIQLQLRLIMDELAALGDRVAALEP